MKSKKAVYNEHAEKREAGGYVAVPHIVLRGQEFAELSPYEVKALMDLLSQYNGKNNGDLAATWAHVSKRGWKSKDTLYGALNGLLEKHFIIKTRQGGRTHKASLYGVTFFKIDACGGKLEIKAPADFRGLWKRYPRAMPDLKPTSYPMNPAVREAWREKDPELIKKLARQPYPSP